MGYLGKKTAYAALTTTVPAFALSADAQGIEIGSPFSDGTGAVVTTTAVAGSIAIGVTATADGTDSVAIGTGASTDATADDSIAIGSGAEANAIGSTAIGTGAVANVANQVVLGGSGDTVNIPNLTSGSTFDALGRFVIVGPSGTLEAVDQTGAIQNLAIADDAVTTNKIANGTIETVDLKDESVTTNKIGVWPYGVDRPSRINSTNIERCWVNRLFLRRFRKRAPPFIARHSVKT